MAKKTTILIVCFYFIKLISSECCYRKPGFLWYNCWSSNEESCSFFCCGCETDSCYSKEKIKDIEDFMESPKFRKFFYIF